MMTTTLLTEEDHQSKTYSTGNLVNWSSRVLSPAQKKQVRDETLVLGRFNPKFDIVAGQVHLKQTKVIYYLDYLKDSRHIVLPKNPEFLDWIGMYHEQNAACLNMTNYNKQNVTVYGNGQRIMGYDEPLICDIEFLALKLTFTGDLNGWVIT